MSLFFLATLYVLFFLILISIPIHSRILRIQKITITYDSSTINSLVYSQTIWVHLSWIKFLKHFKFSPVKKSLLRKSEAVFNLWGFWWKKKNQNIKNAKCFIQNHSLGSLVNSEINSEISASSLLFLLVAIKDFLVFHIELNTSKFLVRFSMIHFLYMLMAHWHLYYFFQVINQNLLFPSLKLHHYYKS